MRILLIPNTTNYKDFKKLYFKLALKNHVEILIWHKELKKKFSDVPGENIKIHKNILYWNMKKYHDNLFSFNIFKKTFLIISDFYWAKNFLNKHKYNKIISFGDREIAFNLALLKIAKIKNITTFININFASGNYKDLINRRLNSRKFKIIKKNNFFSKYFNKQFKKYKKNSFVSFYSFFETVLYFIIGILPKNPWVIGGGNSDYIFVENEIVYRDYINKGCLKKKILISYSLDAINILRSIKKYKKIKQKKIIIFFSQLYEHGDISKKTNLISLNKYCSFIKYLKNKYKLNILVSLHPKQNLNDYSWIKKKFKFKITKQDFSKIIYDSHCVISEIRSSVAVWTRILNKKFYIINFNKRNFQATKELHNSYFENFVDFEKEFKKNLEKSDKIKKNNVNYFSNHKHKNILIEKISNNL